MKNSHLNSGLSLVIKKYYHGFYNKEEIHDSKFNWIIMKKSFTPNSI